MLVGCEVEIEIESRIRHMIFMYSMIGNRNECTSIYIYLQ